MRTQRRKSTKRISRNKDWDLFLVTTLLPKKMYPDKRTKKRFIILNSLSILTIPKFNNYVYF